MLPLETTNYANYANSEFRNPKTLIDRVPGIVESNFPESSTSSSEIREIREIRGIRSLLLPHGHETLRVLIVRRSGEIAVHFHGKTRRLQKAG